MDQSIEQALTSLLPALNGPLPLKLLELGTSMLAQSRTRASNLKAEEEIARAYVCANLACERLKQKLNLPKISPRPPCPPRIYQKLYKYLEQVLPKRRGRPPKASPPANEKRRVSPKAKPKVASTIVPRSNPPSKPKASQGAETSDALPSWILPFIRHLCAHVFRPLAAPYVTVGVKTVLTNSAPCLPNNPRVSAESKQDKIAALVISICIYVTTRISKIPLTPEVFEANCDGAIEVLNLPEYANKGIEKIVAKDVEDWMWELSDRGWMRLSWFTDIDLTGDSDVLARSHGIETGHDDEDSDDGRLEAGKRKVTAFSASRKDTLQSGVGTMMQDKVDYLSEQKRLEYLAWKERIMKMVVAKEERRDRNTAAP